MTPSVETQLALLSHQVTTLVEGMKQISAVLAQSNTVQEETRLEFVKLEHRLGKVEAQLAAASPTIQEFMDVKQRVTGAGVLGKWLWAAGGSILGMAAISREQILKAISGH